MAEVINYTCNNCCISCVNNKKKCIALKLREKEVRRAIYKAKKERRESNGNNRSNRTKSQTI